ncbi:hypothetical protein AB4Z54_43755, partial [Streptomyces sp. MCAF7]
MTGEAIPFETPDLYGAFPRLTEEQIGLRGDPSAPVDRVRVLVARDPILRAHLRRRALLVGAGAGARYRRLDVPGIERLESTSVHYAATVYEAQQCRAGEEATAIHHAHEHPSHLATSPPMLRPARPSSRTVDTTHPRITERTEVMGDEHARPTYAKRGRAG